jgi:hypothetical protein
VPAGVGAAGHEGAGSGEWAMASPFRRVVEFLLENGMCRGGRDV